MDKIRSKNNNQNIDKPDYIFTHTMLKQILENIEDKKITNLIKETEKQLADLNMK